MKKLPTRGLFTSLTSTNDETRRLFIWGSNAFDRRAIYFTTEWRRFVAVVEADPVQRKPSLLVFTMIKAKELIATLVSITVVEHLTTRQSLAGQKRGRNNRTGNENIAEGVSHQSGGLLGQPTCISSPVTRQGADGCQSSA